jgi:predicted ATP-dependent endonuclease of OLD family
MLLRRVEITDFLSIKGKLPIDVDKKVTILLGSNDHGKSNVLTALQHLNSDTPIGNDEVNWDAEGIPSISFVFDFTGDEARYWKTIVEELLRRVQERAVEATKQALADAEAETSANSPSADAAVKPPATPNPPAANPGGSTKKTQASEPTVIPFEELPAAIMSLPRSGVTLTRTGIGSPLYFEGIGIAELPEEMQSFISEYTPRVEIFKAMTGTLQDAATAADIETDDYEFLQGVFFYAGLDPRDCSKVFTRTDKTIRELQNASKTLDTNLRQLWGQGTDLHFHLSHKGSETASEIEFLADDPSIRSQVARMSKRSSGVTQFFTVSMILNARRNKFPANSYIYLFDEPGVYLHPQGQA